MKLNRIVCLLSLFAFCSATVLAQNSFTVGTATAGPGQKATGTLEVAAGVDAATSIPVVVIRGTKPGPVLALVSGAHGTEYASIIALEKVIQSLDPAQVSGTVIILPLVNLASFEQKVPHVNPGGRKEHESLLSRQAGRYADGARVLRDYQTGS
ncbi:MAG TPA: succinylglutamate desuccinylase/aspartoacylase family protein [Candidatus Acidoferrum sp.]|nr:succinylglutamate desuccinylase/aspartoacylase family protein [Candidatus Acidoferrum sp.]